MIQYEASRKIQMWNVNQNERQLSRKPPMRRRIGGKSHRHLHTSFLFISKQRKWNRKMKSASFMDRHWGAHEWEGDRSAVQLPLCQILLHVITLSSDARTVWVIHGAEHNRVYSRQMHSLDEGVWASDSRSEFLLRVSVRPGCIWDIDERGRGQNVALLNRRWRKSFLPKMSGSGLWNFPPVRFSLFAISYSNDKKAHWCGSQWAFSQKGYFMLHVYLPSQWYHRTLKCDINM